MKTKHDPRHIARQVALMSLFEWSFHSDDADDIIHHVLDAIEEEAEVDVQLVKSLVDGTTTNLDGLDQQITVAAPEWPRDQIAKIDICILRLSVYELQYTDVPQKVIIDEAVGVLGTIVKHYAQDSHDKKSRSKQPTTLTV
jgi:N utilization substance protein B